MSKKLIQKPLAAAMGAAFLSSVSAATVVEANENPFAATQLSSGYMQVAMEGKCGEGKCGGSKADEAKAKAKEGKCGEGKCGASNSKGKGMEKANEKAKEGKCGEGKCGGSK